MEGIWIGTIKEKVYMDAILVVRDHVGDSIVFDQS